MPPGSSAYIAQSLLNGPAARRRELLDEQALAENEPVDIIWDIPRPYRDADPSPPQGTEAEPRLAGARSAPDYSAIRRT